MFVSKHEEVDLKQVSFKPFSLLLDDWALLAAGSRKEHNAMTISWGGFGVLWHKLVATVFVRPQRFTKTFIDSNELFSLNFFSEEFKPALQFCGTHSGRDVNKDLESGLVATELGGTVAYEQAKMVLVCKKQFVCEMKDVDFLNRSLLEKFYPEGDFHFVYVAEIVSAFRAKQ